MTMPGGALAGRVLVTGGNGFVGTMLVASLRGDWAVPLELLIAGREPDCDVLLDLERPETIAAAVAETRPNAILHLAGEASVAAASRAAEATWRVNLGGTLALAAAFAAARPEGLFFFSSSAEVYGRAFLAGCVSEDTAPLPDSVYSRSKLAAEQALSDVLPTAARLLVVRPSNHIGPNQAERFAIPSFARQLVDAERTGTAARIAVGNLDAERDFMDVRDVVSAYRLLLSRAWPAGTRETLNLASGTVRPVRELLDMLRGAARVPSEVTVDPARVRAVEIARAGIDATRLATLTGWAPRFPIEQSLLDVLDAVRGQISRPDA